MYYCGIDVAKRSHAVAVLDERGQAHQAVFKAENTRKGLEGLADHLDRLGEEVRIGLEATGHYWLSLYDLLTRRGYAVAVINPLRIHNFRKSGVRKVKSDRTDAVWIADFMRISNLQPSNRDIPALLQLRELSRFRNHIAEQIGGCKRKILTILDRVFPEYESVFSDVFVHSSRAILQEAVTAQEFADFDLSELSRIITHTSRGRFGPEKAVQLQEQAGQSIGVGFLAGAAGVELRLLLAQLELFEEQQAEVEKQLQVLMAQLPQFITTINGVGLLTGAAILSEIGDVNRFDDVDGLVAYAGIDATVFETGQFKGTKMHMSKRGSPFLRLALWQAASMAIQHNAEMKAYYTKKRAEGKPHGTALGAVCRKLLIRIYVVLKENRPYVN